MRKTKLISKIIVSAILLLALTPQGKPIAQEILPQTVPPQATPLQETLPSVPLLRLKCVDTGVGSWARQNQDVVVGKAVYTSRMYMGPGDRSASMTCQLQPNNGGVTFQTLQLKFGMRDNDQGSPAATVNVYLDGNKVESRSVSPGQAASVLRENVSSANNLSIEVVCSNNSRLCSRVYFWEASLGYSPVSPR